MKILVLNAIKEWIVKKFGEDKWREIAEKVGLGVEQFNPQDNYFSDDRFATLIPTICSSLSLDDRQFIAEFIEYWVTDFAPRVYRFYIKKSNTAKEFVIGIFKMNNYVCKMFPNTVMTKVDYQEISRNTITAVYPSEKSLVDIIAVLRGSAHFFADKFTIKKINPHSVQIKFEKVEEI
jgi:hypothetical protein